MNLFQRFLDSHKIQYFTGKELTRLRQFNVHDIPPQDLWDNIIPTVRLADAIRSLWGGPVYANSVWRTPAYNAHVGGVSTSEHMAFRAMDLSVTPFGGDPGEFFYLAQKVVAGARAAGLNVGLGRYNTFLHLDTNASPRKTRNRSFDLRK